MALNTLTLLFKLFVLQMAFFIRLLALKHLNKMVFLRESIGI